MLTMRRNHRWVVLNCLLVLLLTLGLTARAAVERVDAIGITVSDMDRAVAFYRGVLSFVPVSDVEITDAAFTVITCLIQGISIITIILDMIIPKSMGLRHRRNLSARYQRIT